MSREPRGDWIDIFRAFKMSLDVSKLWLAFQGVVYSAIFLAVLLAVVTVSYQASPPRFDTGPKAWDHVSAFEVDLAVQDVLTFAVSAREAAASEIAAMRASGASLGYAFTSKFLEGRAVRAVTLTWAVALLGLLLIWSYYGGAIMRSAAVEYAMGERIELNSALAYARRKHHSFYGAPLGLFAAIVLIGLGPLLAGLMAANFLLVVLAIAGIAGAGVVGGIVRNRASSAAAGAGAGAGVLVVTIVVCVFLGKLGVRIPYVGELVVGLMSPLLFIGGIVMAVLGAWLIFGAPLMAGAIASRDTDTFDAWSRSFHYLVVHPWRYLGLNLAAWVYGAVCLAFIYAIRVLGEWAVLGPMGLGLVGDFDDVYLAMFRLGSSGVGDPAVAPGLLGFFLGTMHFLLNLVFIAFIASYAATAKTIIYFLMRHYSDGTAITEVHLEPRDRELLCPAQPADEK